MRNGAKSVIKLMFFLSDAASASDNTDEKIVLEKE